MRPLAWLLIPFSFLGVALLASQLAPSPTGWGTHQTLGLPPCLFHHLTGWVCPSCGLTTSFAHLMHGHWGAAFRSHPLGPAIFLSWGLLGVGACFEFFGRRTPLGKFLRGQFAPWAYGAMAVYFVTWGVRLVWISSH